MWVWREVRERRRRQILDEGVARFGSQKAVQGGKPKYHLLPFPGTIYLRVRLEEKDLSVVFPTAAYFFDSWHCSNLSLIARKFHKAALPGEVPGMSWTSCFLPIKTQRHKRPREWASQRNWPGIWEWSPWIRSRPCTDHVDDPTLIMWQIVHWSRGWSCKETVHENQNKAFYVNPRVDSQGRGGGIQTINIQSWES